MMFCPKCGSILMPRDVKGKKVIGCSCGYVADNAKTTISEKSKSPSEQRTGGVADGTGNTDVRPSVSEKCPKCGHDDAYTWEIQTRAGDEPATRFFECKMCKNKWREYR